jgi:hypothetical protein
MFPIAHLSASLLSLSVYDKIKKAKNNIGVFSSWFIIIGFAGILPDLLKPHLFVADRISISHSIFFPLFFLGVYLVLKSLKNENSIYPFLFFWGTLLHLILDMVTGVVFIFYPLNDFTFNQSVLFPASLRQINGIWYAHLSQHVIWYLFDAAFLGLYILIDKTNFLEKIFKKLLKKN